VGAVIIYLVESRSFSFFSCFFLSVGAATSSGLTTIDLLDLSTSSLTVLLVLALVG
jgi:hypothetical protein